MRIVSTLPHPIDIYPVHAPDVIEVRTPSPWAGAIRTVERGMAPARIQVEAEPDGDVDGIPVGVEVQGGVTGLPALREDVMVIVSRPVALHPDVRGREDLVVVGDAVRDPDGRVVGCRSLARIR